jgi:hypothetical protein
MPQFVVVVQVFIAERDANHAPHHHGLHSVLHQLRVARVAETGGEALGQTDRPVGFAQQQCTGVRGDRAASNAATTRPPSTGVTSNSFGLRSVGIGGFLRVVMGAQGRARLGRG